VLLQKGSNKQRKRVKKSVCKEIKTEGSLKRKNYSVIKKRDGKKEKT
jgi:hypothetical protein